MHIEKKRGWMTIILMQRFVSKIIHSIGPSEHNQNQVLVMNSFDFPPATSVEMVETRSRIVFLQAQTLLSYFRNQRHGSGGRP